jgi:hypothetical protein
MSINRIRDEKLMRYKLGNKGFNKGYRIIIKDH